MLEGSDNGKWWLLGYLSFVRVDTRTLIYKKPVGLCADSMEEENEKEASEQVLCICVYEGERAKETG